MKGFIDEFKEFAIKGNVIDLAIAVIIGTAFGKIVSSLVADLIMPVLSIVIGGVDFSGRVAQVGNITFKYGIVIQSTVDFIIVAFVIFLAIKGINHLKPKKEELVVETKESIPEEIQLLREIRDALHNRQQ